VNEFQDIDLEFPQHGIAVDAPISEQQPGTTRRGVNVRFHEAMTLRGRGGSRAGISKTIDAQVNGANAIQGMGIVVRADGNALAWKFEGEDFEDDGLYLGVDLISPGDGDTVPNGGGGGYQPSDSFRNDHRVRCFLSISHTSQELGEEVTITATVTDENDLPLGLKRVELHTSRGGVDGDHATATTGLVSGEATFTVTHDEEETITYIATVTEFSGLGEIEARSRNVVRCAWGPVDIAFVQATAGEADVSAPGGDLVKAFTSNVTAGSLLLLHSENADTGSSSYLNTVTDSQGNTWTRIHASNGNGVIFWAIAGSTGACTVTATFVVGAGSLYTVIAIAEYSGVRTSSPVDGTNTNSATSTSWSSGSLTVSQANTLLVGVFTASRIIGIDPALPTLTPGAGFNERLESVNDNGTFETVVVWVDKLAAGASEAVACTASTSYLYTAAGAAFKPPA
jgi:hypothetical protein